jgi:hypothetical protein
MYSKTCPIPVKNVRDKLIETLNLSNELEKKKHVIFSYAMVNLGILKIISTVF